MLTFATDFRVIFTQRPLGRYRLGGVKADQWLSLNDCFYIMISRSLKMGGWLLMAELRHSKFVRICIGIDGGFQFEMPGRFEVGIGGGFDRNIHSLYLENNCSIIRQIVE